MDDQQKIQKQDDQDILEQKQKQSNNVHHLSSYLSQHHKLSQIHFSSQQIKNQKQNCINLLQSRDIKYRPFQFSQEIRVDILCHTLNYEILTAQISYGWFSKNITILTIDRISATHNLHMISQGKQGKVYELFQQKENKSIAIKSTRFDDNNFKQVLKHVIRQYFILCIAAALKIGPQSMTLFGFDIIIYNNSIDFGMQNCWRQKNITPSDCQQIKKKLSILHIFNIIHGDIKPDNLKINYSNSLIFIDFGLSQIINQPLGYLRRTIFKGTYKYCTIQMQQLFNQGSKYIDLYYNDMHSLQLSLEQMTNQENKVNIKTFQIFINNSFLSNDYRDWQLIHIKYLLYSYSYGLVTAESKIIAKNRNLIVKYQYVLKEWMLMLPISECFDLQQVLKIIIYGQYDKNLYVWISQRIKNMKKRFLVQNQLLFRRSYTSLLNINVVIDEKQISQAKNLSQIQIHILSNQKIVKSIEKHSYYLRLIKFIKVNGDCKNKNDIQTVCKNYLQFKNNLKQSQNQSQNFQLIYKKTFYYIFKESCQMNAKQDLNILQQSLETLVIFQVIMQTQLQTIFLKIIQKTFQFIKKASFLLQFLISIEYIKYKIKSDYKYNRLRSLFLCQFQIFVKNSRQLYENDKNHIYEYLDLLFIDQKYLRQQLQKVDQCNLIKTTKMMLSDRQLIKKLKIYLNYRFSCYYLSTNNKWYTNIKLSSLTQQFYDTGQKKFCYFVFFIYQKQYKANSYIACQHIFKVFKDRFLISKNGEIFMINYQHNYIQIYRARKFFLKNLNKGLSQNESIKLKKDLQYLITKTDSFYRVFFYMHQLFCNVSEAFNKNYQQIVTQILIKYHQTIFNFQKLGKHLSLQNHHNIKYFIYSIMLLIIHIRKNNLSFLDIHQLYHKSGQFFQKSLGYIQQVQCKMALIVQFKRLDFIYSSYQAMSQDLLHKLVQLIVLTYKLQEYAITYEYLQFALLYQLGHRKINSFLIEEELYLFFKKTQKYHLCLKKNYDYCSFQNVYFYIVDVYGEEQIGSFILNLTEFLSHSDYEDAQVQFYSNVLKIVRKSTNIYFIRYHLRVVENLFCFELTIANKYLTFYYLALLEIQFRHKNCQKMMIYISKYVDFFKSGLKKMILFRYYHHYLFYFQIEMRKDKFIRRLKIKTEEQKIKREDRLLIFGIRSRKKYNLKQERINSKIKGYIENITYDF